MDEVKAHINHDGAENEDAYLSALLTVARQTCEQESGRALITQTLEGYAPAFDRWYGFPSGPARSVTAVQYYDEENIRRDVPAQSYFLCQRSGNGGGPAVQFADAFCPPRTYARHDAVRVEYTAGYGNAAADVPAPLRHAMLLLIGTWYAQRESIVVGTITAEVPHTVEYLIAPFKNFDGMFA